MENTDVTISPLGHLDSFVNIEYDPWDSASIRTGRWSRTGVARPILPAKEGQYTWSSATSQAVFFDKDNNALMALDDFVPLAPKGLTGEGRLLFESKKNLLLGWSVPDAP